jgi:hypothetical protein
MKELLEEMLGERWKLITVLVLLSFGLVVTMAASHL